VIEKNVQWLPKTMHSAEKQDYEVGDIVALFLPPRRIIAGRI